MLTEASVNKGLLSPLRAQKGSLSICGQHCVKMIGIMAAFFSYTKGQTILKGWRMKSQLHKIGQKQEC